MKNLYAVLGVERDVTPEQLRSIYRQLARQTHPDQPGGSAARFREVREAYETLSDDRRRAAYEAARAAWLTERNLIDCPRCGLTLVKYRLEGVGTRCRVCKATLTEWTASGRLKIRGAQFLHSTADLAEDLVAGSVEVAHAGVDELLTRAQQELRGWLRTRLDKLRVPRRWDTDGPRTESASHRGDGCARRLSGSARRVPASPSAWMRRLRGAYEHKRPAR